MTAHTAHHFWSNGTEHLDYQTTISKVRCGTTWSDDSACPDCSNGQRRHPVTVPCDGLGGEHRQGPCPNDGRISTGLLAVVEFGPLVVQLRPNNVTDADLPGLFISNEGQAVLVLADGRPHHVTLPPDVDTASLVGQWAIGGRIEVAG